MRIKGKALKYGNNIDTDVIIPARYLNTTQVKELAKHCMEGIDKDFHRKADKGDIIVAGENFGCGSSREHAPLAIKAAGLSAVIAISFARIFYRNAINIGLPIFTSPEAVQNIKNGDLIQIDDKRGSIKNLTKNETYSITPLPPFIQEIIASGGLINYTRRKLSYSVR